MSGIRLGRCYLDAVERSRNGERSTSSKERYRNDPAAREKAKGRQRAKYWASKGLTPPVCEVCGAPTRNKPRCELHEGEDKC